MTRNDLTLCDITVKMSYLMSELMHPVTEENENRMFLVAGELGKLTEAYQARLNRIRWPLKETP